MIGISEREGKGKSKQAEKDLRERESNVLAGGGRPEKELDSRLRGNDNTEEKPERITPEQAKTNIQRVGEILKTIGG